MAFVSTKVHAASDEAEPFGFSVSDLRDLGSILDLSNCRCDSSERLSRGRLRNMRDSVRVVWREFHMRKLAHFRRPPSKL